MRAVVIAGIALVGCGTPSKDRTAAEPAPVTAIDASASTSSVPGVASSTAPRVETAAPFDLFTKIEPDLARCYEEGKKAVPTMTSGKITFNASVDASGRATCVVPSDDNGLTQDVENCMRARVEREVLPKKDASWSFALPIVVKDGKLARGELRDSPSAIETIESQGLAEDVYDVVEGLLPSLYQCVSTMKSGSARVITVGARVNASGQVECALASGPATVPAETRACTEKAFAKATFRAPKKGYGLLSVPLNLTR